MRKKIFALTALAIMAVIVPAASVRAEDAHPGKILRDDPNPSYVAVKDVEVAPPEARALSKGYLTVMGLLYQGGDIPPWVFMNNAAHTGEHFEGFAVIAGGSFKLDVDAYTDTPGSYSDTSGVSLMAGLSRSRFFSQGRLIYGAFFEYGSGSYDTYHYLNGETRRSDGDVNYTGGGILARMDFNEVETGRFYAEGSFRAGSLKNEYHNDYLGGYKENGYDSSSSYYGLHLGGGFIRILDRSMLDLYGRYIWTHMEGDSVVLAAGDPTEFDAVNSHRLRFGVRWSFTWRENVTPYIGVAYEHELGGDSNAMTGGKKICPPSLNGGTGIGELGVNIKPSAEGKFSMNLGVQGYAGVREGITGGLQLNWEF